MDKFMKASLALTVVLTACGGDGGGTPPPPPPVFTSLTVSATTVAMTDGDTTQLTATPRDQNNAAMTGLPAATFTSPDAAVSVATTGRVIAVQQGTATVTASLTSGGVTKTATATVNVAALPSSATVTASGTGQTFSPSTVKIAVNGRVTWSFPGPETHNVTFGGAAPPGGNIGNSNSGTAFRDFGAEARYPYSCTLHSGMNGEVIVRTP